jgi:hypothetical protein
MAALEMYFVASRNSLSATLPRCTLEFAFSFRLSRVMRSVLPIVTDRVADHTGVPDLTINPLGPDGSSQSLISYRLLATTAFFFYRIGMGLGISLS